MELFPKFIVANSCIRIGKVSFHKELLDIGDSIGGGGWFHYDSEDNSFTFYGDSHDFGRADVENLKRIISFGNVGDKRRKNRFAGHKFYYCHNIQDIHNRVPLNETP